MSGGTGGLVGDILSPVFGETDPGGYKGENAPLMTPEQIELLNKLIGTISGEIGTGVTPYPGKTVSGLTPLQQNVIDLVMNRVSEMGGGTSPFKAGTTLLAPYLEKADQPYQAGMGALESILGEYSPESAIKAFEPIKAETLATWEKDVLPKVLEPFIAANAMDSGAARRGVAQSGEDITKSLETTLANMIYSGEQAHLDRKAGALPQALSYMTTSLGIPSTAMNLGTAETTGALNLDQILANLGMSVGGTERDVLNQLLGEDYSKWAMSQPYANPWLNYLNLALGSKSFDPIIQGPQDSLLSQLLPAAGQAIGLGVGAYYGAKANAGTKTG